MEPQSAFNNQCTSLIVELRQVGEILPLPERLTMLTHAVGLRECNEQINLTFHSKPQMAQRHVQRCQTVLDDIARTLGELWLKFGHNKYLNDEIHRLWRLMSSTRHQTEPIVGSIHDRLVSAAAAATS